MTQPQAQQGQPVRVVVSPEKLEAKSSAMLAKLTEVADEVIEAILPIFEKHGLPPSAQTVVLETVRVNLVASNYVNASALQTILAEAQSGRSGIIVP
jgi:hypothetical protein